MQTKQSPQIPYDSIGSGAAMTHHTDVFTQVNERAGFVVVRCVSIVGVMHSLEH